MCGADDYRRGHRRKRWRRRPCNGAPRIKRLGAYCLLGAVIAQLQPAPFVRGLAREQTEESCLDRLGDRAALAGADGDLVHRPYWLDFSRRAGHEDLVREIQELTWQRLFAYFETMGTGQRDDGIASDALEDRVREARRVDHAIANHE